MEKKTIHKNLLSLSQKNANDKRWYKDNLDWLDNEFQKRFLPSEDNVSEYKRMKVNYELFNNILNVKDFEYVMKPYGNDVGELPAKMVNRDITSGKIKAVLGMEMKRPFNYRIVAVNPEATTRKEQEQFRQLREFVINTIMKPIQEEVYQSVAQQTKGRELTPDEKKQIQQQVQQELKTRTPDEVKKYMTREHQDPAEVLAHQLLEYLHKKIKFKHKSNLAFKHGLLSGVQAAYVGIFNGEPDILVVNSKRLLYDNSPDLEFIEDGEYAAYEYRMTPSMIATYLGQYLKKQELEKISENWNDNTNRNNDDFFELLDSMQDEDNSTIPVLHGVWKSLRKVGFLTYIDEETGKLEQLIVDENYKMDEEKGDIKIEWEWIPEVYEGWKINISEPIYVNMRPVPGQFKDLDNLYETKLPYYGIVYDALNTHPVSLMDRLKMYQYYYNIIMYRLDLIFASDKGKKIALNIGAIPNSKDFDLDKWQYYFESSPFMFFDFSEEGSTYQDINMMAKEIDLSLASDIQKYMEIAEYLRTQAGRSVGITDQFEGQIGPREAVRNTQQSIIQSSTILELYYNLNDQFKKNLLEALLNTAKIAYAGNKKKKLAYILDDMSMNMLNMDSTLLDNSTYGLFIADSTNSLEIKNLLTEVTHAAVQNQRIELSDIVAVLKQNGLVEIEEQLKKSEDERKEFEQSMQQQQLQAQAEEAEKQRQREREKHAEDMELVVLKEEERRKTEILKAGFLGASYNPDKDVDKNGVNDYIQTAKAEVEAEIKRRKMNLEEKKFEHQKKVDKEKLKQGKK